MQVIVNLDNVLKHYDFPDDCEIEFRTHSDFVIITPRSKITGEYLQRSFFNRSYVVAIVPDARGRT